MTDYSTQIDQIKQAKSLEEIREVARQFSAKATGEGGILYSRPVGNVSSEVIALELAGETGLPIINKTPRAEFLSDNGVKQAIERSAGRIFQAQGNTAELAEKLAGSFQYGDPKAAAHSLTSLDGCLWGDASREFAASLRGDIKVVATAANMERVFGKVELTTILDNPNVKTLGGQSITQLRDIAAKDGLHALLDPVQFQFVEAAPRGIYKSPDVLFNKEASVTLSREFASAMGADTSKFSPAANLSASGTVARADIGMAFRVAQDEANIARASTLRGAVVADSARMTGALVPDVSPGLATLENATARPASVKVAGALGIAGLALEAYDGAISVSTAHRLASEGNATAAKSELMHFGARSVGGWGGAGIGMATGAVLGVESGPGLLVTAAIGGVAGVFVGDKIAEWNDNRGIYNQELGGESWSYDPDKHEEGWRRKAPIDRSDDGIDNALRGDLRASPATENALNYQATSRSVELVLGGPPAQRDPFSLPAGVGDTPSSRLSNWERNPESGQWQREVYGPFVERAPPLQRTEFANAGTPRAALLDGQAAQIVVENAANSPASIAARYEDTYIRNGWAAHGDMPDAVRNARTDIDTLKASDGERYQRQANGRWLNEEGIDSIASGRLHAELEATRNVLQARLPPPREIPPVPPMDADARLRDTVAGAYRNASVDANAEQIAAAAIAVRATWDAKGLDPATTALLARPHGDGRSELASLRLDNDGKTYVPAAVTTPDAIEQARTEMTTSPHEIERASENSRDAREQAQREANRDGLSLNERHLAVAAPVQMAGVGRRDDGSHEPDAPRDDRRQERKVNDALAMAASSTPAPVRLPDPSDPDHPNHRMYKQSDRGEPNQDQAMAIPPQSAQLEPTPSASTPALDITHREHAGHERFQQAIGAIERSPNIPPNTFSGERLQQSAANVAYATLAGAERPQGGQNERFDRIDFVVFNTPRDGLIVGQGELGNPAAKLAFLPAAQDNAMTLTQASQQVHDTLTQQQAQAQHLAQQQPPPTQDDPGPKGPRLS